MSHCRATLRGMKTIDLWRWYATDPATGRRRATRHVMTEADALATDPGAERVLGSLEQRQVPASADEAIGLQAHDGGRRPG